MPGVFDVLVTAMTAIWELGLDVLDFLKFGFCALLFGCAFGFLFSVVRSTISKITTILDPLPDPPLLRRDRRAAATAARRSSLSLPAPQPISEYDIEVITKRGPPPQSLSQTRSLTSMYPSAIEDIITKMARCGLQPKYRHDGLLVDWVPIAPQGARRGLPEVDNTCATHGESDIHAPPVTAEMSARPAASHPSTFVVAAPADLAIDTSPRVGPVEPPRCHSAASAADAGRAHVPTSTEGLVDQVVEPPQGACAASVANPGGAHMPASTDRVAKPTGIVPVANVSMSPSWGTWMPSSGPEKLSPPERHPLFTFGWKPSTGPEYHLREPHPLFIAAFASRPTARPALPPHPVPSVVVPSPAPSPLHVDVAKSVPPVVTTTPMPTPSTLTSTIIARRPPRHARSLPASAFRTSAPTSTLAAVPAPAPIDPLVAVPSAPVLRFSPMDLQNWMAPLSEILALDIIKLGLTEAELMAWEIPDNFIKARSKTSSAHEERTQKDPIAMAARYVEIAHNLKQCGVLLRLQLLQLRRAPQGQFPPRRSFFLLFNTIITAAKQFNKLRAACVEIEQADFSAFKNALRFLLDQVLTMNEFEEWIVHHQGDEAGKRDATSIKTACRFVGDFLGIQKPVMARLGLT